MISINLLSPAKKAEHRLTWLYYEIKNIIIVILLFSICIAIILLFAKMILVNNFNREVEQATLTTRNSVIFSKEVKELNRLVSQIENIQNDYVSWSTFLDQLGQTVPGGISLYNVTVENKTNVLISGISSTREELLQFKENLSQHQAFDDVTIPLDSLFQKENIDFKIKFTLKLQELL